MSIATGKVLRASARWVDTNGSDNVNVFYFRTGFAAPQSEANVWTAVNAYLIAVFNDMNTARRTGSAPLDLKVDVVEWLNGKWEVTQNVGLQGWGSGLTSTSGADALPPGVAALGKLYTGFGKHIGKKFFGLMTEAAADVGGNVVGATATMVLSGLTELLTPYLISAGNQLFSVVLDHLDGTIRDVIEVGVSGNFAYQRRRRPGTGS